MSFLQILVDASSSLEEKTVNKRRKFDFDERHSDDSIVHPIKSNELNGQKELNGETFVDSNSMCHSNGKSDSLSSSSDDDSSVSSKRRGKSASRRKAKRAKPLSLEILHQIFNSLNCTKDCDGNYLIRFTDLKQNDISAKYFAVTEWQCFRKRIMNHGFDIIDEQQSSWIKARPNIQALDGRVLFHHHDLRTKYPTPCKIRQAREKGDLKDIVNAETVGLKEEETFEDKVSSEFRGMLPALLKNLITIGEAHVLVQGYKISMSMKKVDS